MPDAIAATPAQVDAACRAAAAAFPALRDARDSRAAVLDGAADGLAALGDRLLDIAARETGLAIPRLAAERDRTVRTLRVFAGIVREGSWVEAAIDSAQPARLPARRPDLRRMLRPLGPVAVFGASNLPLAYGTAGGDTASALAAGCPVVVKGHPLHPETGAAVAAAVRRAVRDAGLPEGAFAELPAAGERERDVGRELVLHPAISAVGFTGSFAGGTALAALAASRPVPVPVFAEMGSINPVFLLPGALERDAESLAERLFASVHAAAGQQCTKPGLIFLARGGGAERFTRTIAALAEASRPQAMLAPRLREAFLDRIAQVRAAPGVSVLARGAAGEPLQETLILGAEAADLHRTPTLWDECFGPSALLVRCDDARAMLDMAARIPGSLAAAIFAIEPDAAAASALTSILAGCVGRLVHDGVTTGVEVASATVHGGPFPATNQPHSSAVGPTAMVRWCRPVCQQDAPDGLLPPELRRPNPLGIARRVDGVVTTAPA